jgi:hypothetical protein
MTLEKAATDPSMPVDRTIQYAVGRGCKNIAEARYVVSGPIWFSRRAFCQSLDAETRLERCREDGDFFLSLYGVEASYAQRVAFLKFKRKYDLSDFQIQVLLRLRLIGFESTHVKVEAPLWILLSGWAYLTLLIVSTLLMALLIAISGAEPGRLAAAYLLLTCVMFSLYWGLRRTFLHPIALARRLLERTQPTG